MPSKKRRQEQREELKEAAKSSRSLESWIQTSRGLTPKAPVQRALEILVINEIVLIAMVKFGMKAFLSDEHRVDYVQVDQKKTQALQNTKMEWTDVRQSKV